jgi:hypothetical protein
MEANGTERGCEVLVAGPYFADLVFHGLPRPVEPGGEVFAGGFALVPGGAYTLAMAVHRQIRQRNPRQRQREVRRDIRSTGPGAAPA